MNHRWVYSLVAALALLVSSNLKADVKLAGIFGDHMVLQQGAKLPVWGTGVAGEDVTVTVDTESAKTTVGGDGKWRVDLDPLKATDKSIELKVVGKNSTIAIHDVLVGEVWLGSGQSNMVYSLKEGPTHAADVIAAGDQPMIRLCQVGERALAAPASDRTFRWIVCSPNTVKGFSAVTYVFGRDLHDNLKVPVGVICSAVSGTAAQSWTNLSALQGNPDLAHYADDLTQAMQSAQTRPKSFDGGVPTSLYNGMIAPLMPFSIKGVIWYQGESNAGQFAEYRSLFPALIEGWRKEWGQGDFPFLFVQLPGYQKRTDDIQYSDWAYQREAQESALKLPNTGMAVAIDLVPNRGILHPKNKVDIGHRLALVARHLVYGQQIESSGPTFVSMTIDGNQARIKFDHADGLKIAAAVGEGATRPEPPKTLTGFTIASGNHYFVPADAKIDGNTVIVSSDLVKAPVAVRYAWAQNPTVDLYNSADLPAVPFRTDDWTEKPPRPSKPE